MEKICLLEGKCVVWRFGTVVSTLSETLNEGWPESGTMQDREGCGHGEWRDSRGMQMK